MTGQACDFCGEERFRRLPYFYTLGDKKLHGARCAGCGLVTVTPMPSPDEVARMYGEEYFEGDYHCGHRDSSYEDESLAGEHGRVLARFKRLLPAGRMLEVGAAGGKFLARAREAGYEVAGVEISPAGCRMAENAGIPLFCGTLEEASFPDESFDAAYLGDVLEHLPAPFTALRELYRITRPGGVVGVSCPTNMALISSKAGLLAYRLLGRERAAPLPPYHLFEFTPESLVMLMEGAGFRVEKVYAGIIPPWRIKLRGSPAEKAVKALLHWPNFAITALTGLMGDRVSVFARRRAS